MLRLVQDGFLLSNVLFKVLVEHTSSSLVGQTVQRNKLSLLSLQHSHKTLISCVTSLQAYMATDHSTSAATSLHVMIFSILRLVAMKWPFLFRSFKKISAKVIKMHS